MSRLDQFGWIAQSLSRNALGIIALFLVLVYAVAGSVTCTLTHDERLPLIWFLVGAPFVVLLAFYRLVTKHPGNLYAPSAYRNEENFLRSLDASGQRQRIACPDGRAESPKRNGRSNNNSSNN